MQFLKQSTAITLRFGPFLDDTDGKTAETGLTISQADIRLSKNGGDFAQTNDSGGATHDEFGWYYLTLDATDTNTLGRLDVAISESGALPVWREYMVVPSNVWDSLVGGTDALQVHANEITAGLITAAAIATGAIDADALAADAATEVADAVLTRDWTSVTGEASRSVLNALRFLRNKWSISGSTLTVTEEDDATGAWTATLTTDSGADPVTASDPT